MLAQKQSSKTLSCCVAKPRDAHCYTVCFPVRKKTIKNLVALNVVVRCVNRFCALDIKSSPC